MQPSSPLPIFPLPLVACPGEFVPLHIFEARYQDMVRWCRERQARGEPDEFAIFLNRAGEDPARIGSTLRINQILQEYDDGRVDLVGLGHRRCRLLQRFHDRTYDTGTVEWVVDDEDDWDEEKATRAFGLHRVLVRLVTGSDPDDQAYSGKQSLSYYLAPSSGLMLLQKQGLLEARTENARLDLLIHHLTRLIKRLEAVQDIAQAAKAAWEMQQMLSGPAS